MAGVDFVLRLQDRVSAGLRRVQSAVARLTDTSSRATASTDRLGKSLVRLRDEKGRFLAGAGGSKGSGGGILGSIMDRMRSVATDLAGALMRAAAAAAALGAAAAVAFGAMIFRAELLRERVTLAFDAMSGNGAEAFAHMQDLSVKFGMSVDEVADALMAMQRMGFAPDFAEEIYLRLQDMRAVGVTAEQTQRALLAITQIRSAGRVQGDELNQLADAGVSLNYVYDTLADRLGVTTAEVMRMKEAGELTWDIFSENLPEILAAASSNVGGEAGALGERIANETIGGLMGKLSAMGGVVFTQLAESAGPAFQAIRVFLGDLMSDGGGSGMVDNLRAFVAEIAVGMGPILGLLKEFGSAFAEAFGDNLGIAADNATGMWDALRDPATIAAVGRLGATLGEMAGLLVRMAPYGIAAFNALVGPISEVTAALMTLFNLLNNIATVLTGDLSGLTGVMGRTSDQYTTELPNGGASGPSFSMAATPPQSNQVSVNVSTNASGVGLSDVADMITRQTEQQVRQLLQQLGIG